MFKKLVGVLVCATFLTACNSTDEQLSVGEYDDENNVIFSQEVITNEEEINQFKSIINEAESLGSQPNEIPKEEPVHIVRIDNQADSTIVMYVSIWNNDNSTFIISRGFNNEENSFLLLDDDLSKQLSEILEID
ncbi:hypothetical protein [Alkalicoccobacillus plakortidis]|uniref:Lipoprotein n=1 Tax=Alkalicoccobacillus plakortidis TaxID=444060 RepID=A0ABT0XNC7_9BACI|nr:hypothetical protein [Alkalicoccobacillus plakortidis]MCM2677396.1 hypothetical protein [Alkalicoccobacillus plakortidis]